MRKTILLSLIVLLLASRAGAQAVGNGNDLIMECTRIQNDGAHRQMVIWYPLEFWDMVKEQSRIPESYVSMIKEEMKHYLMFCVADYTQGISGLKFATEEEVRKKVTLTDSSGKVYHPVPEEDISSSAAVLVNSMKPVMGQMLGQFGEGMVILLFKAEQEGENPVISVAKPNRFTLNFGQKDFVFKLPLGSALPPKTCPVDKEPMKGNWNYCPEHGVKLD